MTLRSANLASQAVSDSLENSRKKAVKTKIFVSRIVSDRVQFTQVLGDFEILRTSLEVYNASVATANAVVEARKRQAQAANVRDVENDLSRLKAVSNGMDSSSP